jgi:hypothetical protein
MLYQLQPGKVTNSKCKSVQSIANADLLGAIIELL